MNKLLFCRASDVLSLVLGTLNCATSDKSRKDVTLEDGGLSMITVGADKSDPAFDIVAIIEPLSRGAQKILPILLVRIFKIVSDIHLVQQCNAGANFLQPIHSIRNCKLLTCRNETVILVGGYTTRMFSSDNIV